MLKKDSFHFPQAHNGPHSRSVERPHIQEDFSDTSDENKAVPVITVDGLSGSGKGTLAKRLAQALCWYWLDSGMIYRAYGWLTQQAKLDPADAPAIVSLIERSPLRFAAHPLDPEISPDERIYVDEHLIPMPALRSAESGQLASKIAVLPSVRRALLAVQRAQRCAPGLVADGRDMGTVVFPDARLKFYLTASVEARAKRRYEQLKLFEKHVSLREIEQHIAQRDSRDQQRTIAPATPAKEAHLIDTSHLSIDAVFDQAWALLTRCDMLPSRASLKGSKEDN